MDKEKYKVLFSSPIDFKKEVMLEKDQVLLYGEDSELFKRYPLKELFMVKAEYEKKMKEFRNRINRHLFVISKTGQVVCDLPQREQEELRSKYYFCKEMIKNINRLIRLKQVTNI